MKNQGIKFIHPNNFEKSLKNKKKKRKILLTIDDGLLSFYQNAWPILKEKKFPFILLFVNTEKLDHYNYMNWKQIRELYDDDNVEIGNHSHSHEYLVDETSDMIRKDITKSIDIFKENLGENSEFFFHTLLENTVWNLKRLFKTWVLNMLLANIQG